MAQRVEAVQRQGTKGAKVVKHAKTTKFEGRVCRTQRMHWPQRVQMWEGH